MQTTEAEKNLISFLRTRKPYEVVTIRFDREGKPDFYIVNTEQKLVITDCGIKEVSTKPRYPQ
jgi:hypothetical protein